VAAQYPGSAAAMNLVLDHDVKMRLTKRQGAPPFNAFPILLAPLSGNFEPISRVHQAGDRRDSARAVAEPLLDSRYPECVEESTPRA
jgi:hypothetical protein